MRIWQRVHSLIIGDGRTNKREVFLICNDRLMHTMTPDAWRLYVYTKCQVIWISRNIVDFRSSWSSMFKDFGLSLSPILIPLFRPLVTASPQSLSCIACTAACFLCFARSPPPLISVVISCWNQTNPLHWSCIPKFVMPTFVTFIGSSLCSGCKCVSLWDTQK